MSEPLQIEPPALAAMQASGTPPAVLDVREQWELDLCRLPAAIHIPLGELARRFEEVPRDRPVVVVCHHGGRSMQATQWLRAQGWERTINLRGGMDAWARQVDPTMAVY